MPRIAIVDDEPDITEALKKGLEQNGFAVETFNDPRLALSNFRPGYYDLVIMDIRMPHLNGFELYRELKKLDSKVKVSFLTAFEIYHEEFKKIFPNIEARPFITKPVSIAALVTQINSAINLS